MSNTLIILGSIALVCVVYYSYKRKKGKTAISQEDSIAALLGSSFWENAEEIDILKMSDVVSYFKGLHLKKEVDVPFLAKAVKNELTCYLLAVYNEEDNTIKDYKLVAPKSVDEQIKSAIGNEKLIVLN